MLTSDEMKSLMCHFRSFCTVANLMKMLMLVEIQGKVISRTYFVFPPNFSCNLPRCLHLMTMVTGRLATQQQNNGTLPIHIRHLPIFKSFKHALKRHLFHGHYPHYTDQHNVSPFCNPFFQFFCLCLVVLLREHDHALEKSHFIIIAAFSGLSLLPSIVKV